MINISQFQATVLAICSALMVVIPTATVVILRGISSLKLIINTWRGEINGSLDKRIETIVKAQLHESNTTATPVVVNVGPGDSSVPKQIT